MSFQKRLKNQTVINPPNKSNSIREQVVLQKRDVLNKNLNELQNFEEKKVFSKSYETNPKGKENQKNSSTDFIIKRNESSRGREGKTTNMYLNKSINNVKIFLLIIFRMNREQL